VQGIMACGPRIQAQRVRDIFRSTIVGILPACLAFYAVLFVISRSTAAMWAARLSPNPSAKVTATRLTIVAAPRVSSTLSPASSNRLLSADWLSGRLAVAAASFSMRSLPSLSGRSWKDG
jgi:hypothetical protein